MKKTLLILPLLFLAFINNLSAQRFGYIDSEFILSQMPEYRSSQKQLDELSAQWQKEIELKKSEMDKMFKEYNAEKVLLTPQQIKEREESILKKEVELNEFQQKKFGYEGELFKKRQELIKPIQDKLYNAIQKVAKENVLDFILDKSGNLTMLYTNPKYDKSEDVLQELGIVSQK